MTHVQIMQMLPQRADTQHRIVRQSNAFGENQVSNSRSVFDDSRYCVVGEEREGSEIEVAEMVELLERGIIAEGSGHLQSRSVCRHDEFSRRRLGVVQHDRVGVDRRKRLVVDLAARSEGKFSEMMRRRKELEEGDGGDAGTGDEIDLEEKGTEEGKKNDGGVRERRNRTQFNLRGNLSARAKRRERVRRLTRRNPGQPRAIASTPRSVTWVQPVKFNPCNRAQFWATASRTWSLVSRTSLRSRATRRSQLVTMLMRAAAERAVQAARVRRSR